MISDNKTLNIIKFIKLKINLLLFLLLKFRTVRKKSHLFISKFYKVVDFIGLEESAKKYPNQVILIKKYFSTIIYSEPVFEVENINNVKVNKNDDFPNFITEYRDVSILGGSNLILLRDDLGVYESKSQISNENIFLTDQGLKYQKIVKPNKYCIIFNEESNIIINEGIMFSGNFTFNYYHLFYEFIAKFQVLDSLDIKRDIPLIIDSICFKIPQYKELFDLFNQNQRQYVLIEKRMKYKVGKLLSFTSPNFIPPDVVNINKILASDCLFNPMSIDFLRTKLIAFKSNDIYPKRFYLSRKKASNRRGFNEDEVYECLKNYGFVQVHPEDLNISQQVALFNGAEFIIGGSGAAFTNLLFCEKGCKVIIFFGVKVPTSYFSNIANYLLLKLIYVTDENKDINKIQNIHEPFKINIAKLDKTIQEFININ